MNPTALEGSSSKQTWKSQLQRLQRSKPAKTDDHWTDHRGFEQATGELDLRWIPCDSGCTSRNELCYEGKYVYKSADGPDVEVIGAEAELSASEQVSPTILPSVATAHKSRTPPTWSPWWLVRDVASTG